MAPPTRHSSRLGAAGLATALKESENADSNLVARPASRSLRGRKDPLITTKPTTTAAGKPIAASVKGTITANVRKRILDDRTNNVKSSVATNSTTTLKAGGLAKKEPLLRKTSTTARKAPIVLDDAKSNAESVAGPTRRTIRPIKRETSGKSATTRKPTADQTDRPGPSTQASRTALTRTVSTSSAVGRPRRGSVRSTATTVKNGTVHGDGIYEAAHAPKRARTSEPEEIEKENQTGPAAAKADERRKKSLIRNLEHEITNGPVAGLFEEVLKEGEEGWEDLDEGDEGDPLMVKEYVNEIYLYMRKLELETLPDPDYMSRQNELTWKMRGVLVDWIIEVHSKFRLLPETLYVAINLMDRFLSKRTVALIKFQLVGVTALFLAAKYEEVVCPSVSNFLYMTDGGYDCEEILKAETYMLEMLDWDLRYPNPLNFLRRISKADEYDIQSRTFAKYFMEISVVDHRLVATPPSLLAATSIWLSRKMLGRGCWNANLIHYSGYIEPEILPVAQTMLDYILRSGCKTLGLGLEPAFVGAVGYEGSNDHGNLYKKYATRKFLRTSELVREWAVDRYTFETPAGWEWDRLEEWTQPSRELAAEQDDEEEDEDEEQEEL